jgi:alanine racemase
VLEGIHAAEQLDDACAQKLELVFHHPQQLDWLEQTAVNEPLTVWIKLDTGMHRLGFRADELASVWQRLIDCQWVSDIRLMTHFANADNRNSLSTNEQIQHFNDACEAYPVDKSLANSAGVLGWPEAHADWVRPGIMLYGSSPFLDGDAVTDDLQPVMTLRSQLIAINEYQAGDAIGYGSTFVCDRPMRVGVIAIGYGDGYPRHARTGTPVLVKGQRCQLLGRVSMDMISIDLTDIADAQIGDEALLWGEGLSVDEVARCADTISYELLCGLTRRVQFNVVED